MEEGRGHQRHADVEVWRLENAYCIATSSGRTIQRCWHWFPGTPPKLVFVRSQNGHVVCADERFGCLREVPRNVILAQAILMDSAPAWLALDDPMLAIQSLMLADGSIDGRMAWTFSEGGDESVRQQFIADHLDLLFRLHSATVADGSSDPHVPVGAFVRRLLEERGLRICTVPGDGWCWATALLASRDYTQATAATQQRLLQDDAWIKRYTRPAKPEDARGVIEDCATGRLVKEIATFTVRKETKVMSKNAAESRKSNRSPLLDLYNHRSRVTSFGSGSWTSLPRNGRDTQSTCSRGSSRAAFSSTTPMPTSTSAASSRSPSDGNRKPKITSSDRTTPNGMSSCSSPATTTTSSSPSPVAHASRATRLSSK